MSDSAARVAALKFGAVLLLIATAPGIAGERADRRALEALLERTLLNQRGTSKIAMAQFVPDEFLDQEVLRAICTDIDTGGAVSYVKPWSILGPKEVLDLSELRQVAEPGTVMQVAKVEVEKDRVALTLLDTSTRRYSRARLWFEDDFASRLGAQAVLVRTAIVMRFDDPLGELLERAASAPVMELDELQAAYDGAPRGAAKLTSGHRLVIGLDREIGLRRAWSRVLGQPGEVSDLERRRAGVVAEMSRLAEELHGPRLEEIRAEVAAVEQRLDSIPDNGSTGLTRSDVSDLEQALSQWRQLVDEYVELGGPEGASLQAALGERESALAAARRDLVLKEEDEAAAAAASARAAFGETAAGSVEGLRAQELQMRTHVELVDRRLELLAELASPAPGAVTARLEEDISRQKRMGELIELGRSALGPQILEAEFRDLEAKRRKLYDEFTLAFGGPRHREAGRTLVQHLDRMIENRRRLAAMGDSGARAQVQQLESTKREVLSQTP